MPYEVGALNLPKNVKDLPKAKQSQWVSVFNSTWKKARADNKTPKEADEIAFRMANGVLKEARGEGKGVGGEIQGDGGTDVCICSSCGNKQKHDRGIPCVEMKCSKCGAKMTGVLKESDVENKLEKTNSLQSEKSDFKISDSLKAQENKSVNDKMWEKLRESKVKEIIDELPTREIAEDNKAKINDTIEQFMDAESSDELPEGLKEKVESAYVLLKEAVVFKTEGGVRYPKEAYAYVPDAAMPSTWKLRLWDKEKELTRKQIGAAAASFSPGGFRGQKVKLPREDVALVKSKIRAAYRKLGAKKDEIPRWIREGEEMRNYVNENGAVLIDEATADKLAKGIVPVRFLSPGFNSSKGRFYSEQSINDAVEVFEGAKMFANHPTKEDERNIPERRVQDWVATLKNTKLSDSGNAVGEAHINAGWLKEKVQNLAEQGDLGQLGLSILGIGKSLKTSIEGTKTMLIEGILKGKSVDFVTEPGAGGYAGLMESASSDLKDLDIIGLDDLKESRPDLIEILETEFKTNQEKEIKTMAETEKTIEELNEKVATIEKERDELQVKIEEADKDKAKAVAQESIKSIIAEADVPEVAKTKLLAQFADADSDEGVKEAVEAERTYLAALSEGGIVKGFGKTKEPEGDKDAVAKLKESRKANYIDEGFGEATAEKMASDYVKGM